jgi:hypothetical protein
MAASERRLERVFQRRANDLARLEIKVGLFGSGLRVFRTGPLEIRRKRAFDFLRFFSADGSAKVVLQRRTNAFVLKPKSSDLRVVRTVPLEAIRKRAFEYLDVFSRRFGGGAWKVAFHESLVVALAIASDIVILILRDYLRESRRLREGRERIGIGITRCCFNDRCGDFTTHSWRIHGNIANGADYIGEVNIEIGKVNVKKGQAVQTRDLEMEMAMAMKYRIRKRAVRSDDKAWKWKLVSEYRIVKKVKAKLRKGGRAWNGNGNEMPNQKDSQAVRRHGLVRKAVKYLILKKGQAAQRQGLGWK